MDSFSEAKNAITTDANHHFRGRHKNLQVKMVSEGCDSGFDYIKTLPSGWNKDFSRRDLYKMCHEHVSRHYNPDEPTEFIGLGIIFSGLLSAAISFIVKWLLERLFSNQFAFA